VARRREKWLRLRFFVYGKMLIGRSPATRLKRKPLGRILISVLAFINKLYACIGGKMKTNAELLIIILTFTVISINGCTPSPALPLTPTTETAILLTPTPTPTSVHLGNPLQLENNLPQTKLSPKQSQELLDNHIGAWFENYGRFYDTNLVYSNGFKRIRIGNLVGNGQKWNASINSETLSPEVDNTISEYSRNGVSIVLNMAIGSGVNIQYTNFDTTFKNEEDINTYLKYARFVVQHFKGRVQYFEILNETGYITVETYANLIRQVVPVIREVDKNAKIIIGAMWGRWENGYPGYGEYQRSSLALDYFNELLVSGVVDMVDGISWHPLYDHIPSDPYYQGYPQMVQGIKDLAASQGFTGEYFADEILWQTVDEPDWDNGPPVTPSIATKYYTRAITEHRGLGINLTINTWFIEPNHLQNTNSPEAPLSIIHNLCDTLAGAEPSELSLSVETNEDANVRHYAFVLPNGDKLVALWANDEAVEEDPGVSATLTIPGSSAQKVTGVDVLNGFEQELVTEAENGDLVIRNLLVKDYPIILRFEKPNFAEPRFVDPTESPVEPVTIKLKRNGEERIPAGTPIQLTIDWLADTEEQVTDFMAAIDVTGKLDGQPLPDLNGYWGEIKLYEDAAGGQSGDYLSQWLYPLGVLSPGTHTVEIWLTLDRPVTDGFDLNNDGRLDEYVGEICRFFLSIEVY
jgi:hypothetical protein